MYLLKLCGFLLLVKHATTEPCGGDACSSDGDCHAGYCAMEVKNGTSPYLGCECWCPTYALPYEPHKLCTEDCQGENLWEWGCEPNEMNYYPDTTDDGGELVCDVCSVTSVYVMTSHLGGRNLTEFSTGGETVKRDVTFNPDECKLQLNDANEFLNAITTYTDDYYIEHAQDTRYRNQVSAVFDEIQNSEPVDDIQARIDQCAADLETAKQNHDAAKLIARKLRRKTKKANTIEGVLKELQTSYIPDRYNLTRLERDIGYLDNVLAFPKITDEQRIAVSDARQKLVEQKEELTKPVSTMERKISSKTNLLVSLNGEIASLVADYDNIPVVTASQIANLEACVRDGLTALREREGKGLDLDNLMVLMEEDQMYTHKQRELQAWKEHCLSDNQDLLKRIDEL